MENQADWHVDPNVKIFNDSFQRVQTETKNGKTFFDAFYYRFIASSPEVGEKFKNTDMAAQKKMLRDSLSHVVRHFVDGFTSERLEEVAEAHSKTRHNIPRHLYDLWYASIIAAVKEYDAQITDEVEAAWEAVLKHGIEYMISKYESR